MQQGDEGRSTPAHHVLAKTKTRLVSLCQVHAGGKKANMYGLEWVSRPFQYFPYMGKRPSSHFDGL